MAVKIRLKRMGKIRNPFYRVVVADSRKKRDGRVIEEIGTYNPKTEPSTISIDNERAAYWLSVGAQPTEAVAALLKITGATGEKSTLKTAEAKADKAALFDAALKELHAEPKKDATTAKKKADKKADEAPAEEAKADDAPAEEAKTEEPSGDEAAAEAAPAADGDETKAEEA